MSFASELYILRSALSEIVSLVYLTTQGSLWQFITSEYDDIELGTSADQSGREDDHYLKKHS